MISEHKRLQLEATKLDADICFTVTVFERRARTGTRYFAETQCSDPNNFIVQFIIRDGGDLDEIMTKLQRQMVYRGYVPHRYRMWDKNEETGYQRWLAWTPIAPDEVVKLHNEVNPGIDLGG